MAKKLVKKAAAAAAKKSAKRPASVKVAAKSAKPSAAGKSAKPTAKAAPTKPAKAVAGKAAADKTVGKPVAPKAAVVKAAKPASNGKPAANAKPSHDAKPAPNVKAVSPVGAKPSTAASKANAIAAKVPTNAVVISIKPGAKTGEAPKPSGKPMLMQGPIAVRPMGKRATLPPTPVKDPVKPVRKRALPSDEPKFVVVQPPTKAVATSEKAAKNKAGLSQKDLDFFRDLLLAKRRELLGDMNSMEREALRENSTDLSNLPVHMADQGTDAYEQEFTLHLVEKDRSLLRELNDALAKIQNGTYGLCEGTGLPISKARLEAQPWARHSIEHARALEKRQMMFRR